MTRRGLRGSKKESQKRAGATRGTYWYIRPHPLPLHLLPLHHPRRGSRPSPRAGEDQEEEEEADRPEAGVGGPREGGPTRGEGKGREKKGNPLVSVLKIKDGPVQKSEQVWW